MFFCPLIILFWAAVSQSISFLMIALFECKWVSIFFVSILTSVSIYRYAHPYSCSLHAYLGQVSMRWRTLLLQTALFWFPSQTRRYLPWSTESVHGLDQPHTAPVYQAGRSDCAGSRMKRAVFCPRSLCHQQRMRINWDLKLNYPSVLSDVLPYWLNSSYLAAISKYFSL